jgi:hypothetical protein
MRDICFSEVIHAKFSTFCKKPAWASAAVGLYDVEQALKAVFPELNQTRRNAGRIVQAAGEFRFPSKKFRRLCPQFRQSQWDINRRRLRDT